MELAAGVHAGGETRPGHTAATAVARAPDQTIYGAGRMRAGLLETASSPAVGETGRRPCQHVALVGFETTVAPRQAPFPFLAVRRADCLLPCSLPFAAVTAAQTRST